MAIRFSASASDGELEKGAQVILRVAATNAGVAVTFTNTGATVKVLDPTGTITTYTNVTTPAITVDTDGSLMLALTVTTVGLWVHSWHGTTPVGASSGTFTVRDTPAT